MELDSYTPLPETLEAIKDLFCHPEDFSPDFLEFARAFVRNQDTAGPHRRMAQHSEFQKELVLGSMLAP